MGPVAVSRRLGHASVSITLGIYGTCLRVVATALPTSSRRLSAACRVSENITGNDSRTTAVVLVAIRYFGSTRDLLRA